MQGILEISILFIQLKDMQVFVYVKLITFEALELTLGM